MKLVQDAANHNLTETVTCKSQQ